MHVFWLLLKYLGAKDKLPVIKILNFLFRSDFELDRLTNFQSRETLFEITFGKSEPDPEIILQALKKYREQVIQGFWKNEELDEIKKKMDSYSVLFDFNLPYDIEYTKQRISQAEHRKVSFSELDDWLSVLAFLTGYKGNKKYKLFLPDNPYLKANFLFYLNFGNFFINYKNKKCKDDAEIKRLFQLSKHFEYFDSEDNGVIEILECTDEEVVTKTELPFFLFLREKSEPNKIKIQELISG
jgi:hypothetical protein